MKLYFKYVSMHIRSMLEYKASFITSLLAQIPLFFTYYFFIVALFDKFGNIKGYTLYEVLLCFAVIHFGYSFCETFLRGIDKFDRLIITGTFDRFLLRPKGIMYQVILSDFDIIKIMRTLQSLIILVISLINLKIVLTPLKVVTLILMLVSAIMIFASLFIVAAAYCFWTVQGLEIRNAFTDGGKHLAQYPISIFKKGVIYFFTFIIPYAFVNYYPLLYFLGKTNNPIYAISPIITILYLIPALIIFRLGLKKYSSVGS